MSMRNFANLIPGHSIYVETANTSVTEVEILKITYGVTEGNRVPGAIIHGVDEDGIYVIVHTGNITAIEEKVVEKKPSLMEKFIYPLLPNIKGYSSIPKFKEL
jgi:predicted polyphosphate/ATP-dependent NAD kinase